MDDRKVMFPAMEKDEFFALTGEETELLIHLVSGILDARHGPYDGTVMVSISFDGVDRTRLAGIRKRLRTLIRRWEDGKKDEV